MTVCVENRMSLRHPLEAKIGTYVCKAVELTVDSSGGSLVFEGRSKLMEFPHLL